MDTGFNREPGGTLNSMTRGGKNHYYLTEALGSLIIRHRNKKQHGSTDVA
ncbi:hypothetical protein [Streptomyces cyaneofuscatus]